jgi:hypothetical protein
MKRTYEIEWPNELGEDWLNDQILHFYLQTHSHYPILLEKPVKLTRVNPSFLKKLVGFIKRRFS